jgi:NAD(P)-dependent dehydrogenase (short-subunit alcohol dehydrogenase family)
VTFDETQAKTGGSTVLADSTMHETHTKHRVISLRKDSTMNRLENKIATITGGSRGIGLATAQRFVDEGASVFIVGRRQSELDKAVQQIGRNVTAVQTDVTKLDDLDRLFAIVKERRGKIDALFANSGSIGHRTLDEITPEHYDATRST